MAADPAQIMTEDDGPGPGAGGAPETPPGAAQGGRPAGAPRPAQPARQAQAAPEVEYVMVDEAEAPAADAARPGAPAREGRMSEAEAGEKPLLEQRREAQQQQGKLTREQLDAMTPAERLNTWKGMSYEEKRENAPLRRMVRRESRDRDHEETDQLKQRVEDLSTQLDALKPLGNRITELDTARQRDEVTTIDRALADREREKREAQRAVFAAATAGDEEAGIAAFDRQNEAQLAIWRLTTRKQQIAAAASQVRQPAADGGQRQQPQPAADPNARRAPAVRPISARERELIGDFLADHDWVNPQGGDVDSDIVIRLDKEIAAEGYDPNTAEYFDELRDRAQRYLPHHFPQAASRRAQQNARQANGNGAGAQRGPRTPAPANGAAPGKVRVLMTQGRKDELIRMGVLDRNGKSQDDVALKRYLAQFSKYDSEHGVEVRQ